jgi:hypothetical protein
MGAGGRAHDSGGAAGLSGYDMKIGKRRRLEKARANRMDQLYLFPDSKREKMDVNDNGRR